MLNLMNLSNIILIVIISVITIISLSIIVYRYLNSSKVKEEDDYNYYDRDNPWL